MNKRTWSVSAVAVLIACRVPRGAEAPRAGACPEVVIDRAGSTEAWVMAEAFTPDDCISKIGPDEQKLEAILAEEGSDSPGSEDEGALILHYENPRRVSPATFRRILAIVQAAADQRVGRSPPDWGSMEITVRGAGAQRSFVLSHAGDACRFARELVGALRGDPGAAAQFGDYLGVYGAAFERAPECAWRKAAGTSVAP